VSLPLSGGEFEGLEVVEEGIWSGCIFVLVLECMCLGLSICVVLLVVLEVACVVCLCGLRRYDLRGVSSIYICWRKHER
jgi:hypothetical protein